MSNKLHQQLYINIRAKVKIVLNMSMTGVIKNMQLSVQPLPRVRSSWDFTHYFLASCFVSIIQSSHLCNVLCAAHSALRFLTPAEASACPKMNIRRQNWNLSAMQCTIFTTNTNISNEKETHWDTIQICLTSIAESRNGFLSPPVILFVL